MTSRARDSRAVCRNARCQWAEVVRVIAWPEVATDAFLRSGSHCACGWAMELLPDEPPPAPDPWPDPHDFIVELREALGMFAGAMPKSPRQAWEEALAEVRRLREHHGLVRDSQPQPGVSKLNLLGGRRGD